jgi:glycosyltransferase involved in cell wall biosynthesis
MTAAGGTRSSLFHPKRWSSPLDHSKQRNAPWWRAIRKAVAVRLGVFRHYTPRPLRLPRHYLHHRAPVSLSVSIVTPSFNYGGFLERTIRSVLEQQYPHLQYIIQDGLSSDETPGVLAKYRTELAHCESVADHGQAQALNLGFQHATGEIMAYLNADDLLLPGTIHYVADYFAQNEAVDVVYGHRIIIDEHDAEIGRWILPPHDNAVLSWADYIPQESLFWRRRIWERSGAAMDETYQFALDWDLILRFRAARARFVRLPRFLGAFRYHPRQKTIAQMASKGIPEMQRIRERCQGKPVKDIETAHHIAGYLARHVICDRLYRLGLLRY